MEPTNRRETGTRPSAMKRYGPFIAIVVVLAIVGVVIAVAGGGGGDDKKQAGLRAGQDDGRPGHDQRLEPGLDRLGPEL